MTCDAKTKTMRGLGFSCDPSTAGSSVRFDPPDPRDPVSETLRLLTIILICMS